MVQAILSVLICGTQWTHPAGMVDASTVEEVRTKVAAHAWAADTLASRKKGLATWLEHSREELAAVFPRKRGNVYHNFSDPETRVRLAFDPFECKAFRSPATGKVYAPETDAGIYVEGDKYHGTMYDGWACLFYLTASSAAADLGLIGELEHDEAARQRGIDILMEFATTLEGLPLDEKPDPQFSRILTYHREGDNKVLSELARAYEILRAYMTEDACARIERSVIQRMYDDIMRERIYTYDHNNIYQWHRTILQVAVALEREDLIDWVYGYGGYTPEREPEHRSIRRIAATHFKPDGAYWELCSGYHLYPVFAFCDLAVFSRNLSAMDPERFPPERYDLTHPDNPEGRSLKAALHWFMGMAMPDRTVTVIGDSTVPRAGMADYQMTAEIGYRYYGVTAVGDYETLREGKRSWEGLLYGSPVIEQHEIAPTSSLLSSGWVSLRNTWQGNKVWAGLNAMIPGGGHQHADRLTLVTYGQGELLALEKATPYNESVTRELGTLTPMHNTVVVNKRSQPQGEALKDGQIPQVAFFHAGPVAQYAEAWGDGLYEETRTYRRSVALIEDVLVDCFLVEGANTADWIAHHAGTVPVVSLTMEAGSFEPEAWLYHGAPAAQLGRGDEAWSAIWKVGEVSSRMTMAGAPGTEAYVLGTYPIANAVVTDEHPPCPTLCVRRHGDTAFIAVWDMWKTTPNLQGVTEGEGARSVKINTRGNVYYLKFGAGEAVFADGVRLTGDGACLIWRHPDGLLLVGGSRAEVAARAGAVTVEADAEVTVSAVHAAGRVDAHTYGAVQYDTVGGEDIARPEPATTLKWGGDLWPVEE